MNNILTLKGKDFTQEKRKNGFSNPEMPANSKVTLEKLKDLHSSLLSVTEFWEEQHLIEGVLVSVYYKSIVAKSNRLMGYLTKGVESSNDTIVGAKFNNEKTKHIITHYLTQERLRNTVAISDGVIRLFEQSFTNGMITAEEFKRKEFFDSLNYDDYPFSKTTFKKFIRDACYIEKFGIEEAVEEELGSSIITLYDVQVKADELLKKVGIEVSKANLLDSTTVLLDEKNVSLLFSRAPYLVSMAVKDFTEIDIGVSSEPLPYEKGLISAPGNEPVIGLIDTLFDNRVYFHDWVESYNLVPDAIKTEPEDYKHGTSVASLLVDGHNLNKNLDDGCGNFRVRHFGVALHTGFASFTIIKQIREIVSQNLDIKVWNLSLGSNDEIRDNFISAEAAVLDEIQFEYDVLFVIAGTNAPTSQGNRIKIGAPADSINSLIVNSVDFNGNPTDYSRQGIVLSFFMKPDVSYYGGGNNQFINVCEPLGLQGVTGTSYAAPLIARKLAYLIEVIGLRREEAKALLIDSAIGWNSQGQQTYEERTLIGNGIVPIQISEILSSPDDEIRFIVSDISEKYNSYNYDFPVPIVKEHYPYVAKVTMCYFPKCSRNQGVDYTNTELNVTFGRLSNGKRPIEPINHDTQNTEGAPGYIKEDSARNIFRKWDNVKHVGENFNRWKKNKPILEPDNPQWGMSVKTIERLKSRDGEGIRFGVVVTLKELNGVNRIEDFVRRAQLKGWLVNEIRVENRVNLFNRLSEDIEFD